MAAGQLELKRPPVRVTVMDEYAVVHSWLNQKVIDGEIAPGEAQERMRAYESGAKSWSPVFKDGLGNLRLIHKLSNDLGSVFGRVYFKMYKGVEYVIWKGCPKIRQIITGTRYKVTHPKMVEFQIGKAGLKGAARESFIFGAIFVTAIDIADYFMRDSATLGELVGNVGVDIAKVAVASGAGFATAALVAGTIVGTFALGPLVVGFIAAVAVGWALDKLDERFGLTAKLSRIMDQAFDKIERFYEEKSVEAEAWARRVQNSAVVTDLSRDAKNWWEKAAETFGRVNWSYWSMANFHGI